MLQKYKFIHLLTVKEHTSNLISQSINFCFNNLIKINQANFAKINFVKIIQVTVCLIFFKKKFQVIFIMFDWFSSKEENTENNTVDKTVESNGHVNNNIIIQEARDVHQQRKLNEKLVVATYFLCAMELIKFTIYLYLKLKKSMKKKYEQKQSHQPNRQNRD